MILVMSVCNIGIRFFLLLNVHCLSKGNLWQLFGEKIPIVFQRKDNLIGVYICHYNRSSFIGPCKSWTNILFSYHFFYISLYSSDSETYWKYAFIKTHCWSLEKIVTYWWFNKIYILPKNSRSWQKFEF